MARGLSLSGMQKQILALSRINQLATGTGEYSPRVFADFHRDSRLMTFFGNIATLAEEVTKSLAGLVKVIKTPVPWLLSREKDGCGNTSRTPYAWVQTVITESKYEELNKDLDLNVWMAKAAITGCGERASAEGRCSVSLYCKPWRLVLAINCDSIQDAEQVAGRLAADLEEGEGRRGVEIRHGSFRDAGTADLWFSEGMADICGLRQWVEPWCRDKRRLPGGTVIDRARAGAAAYNRANAALSRSLRRLCERQLLWTERIDRDDYLQGTAVFLGHEGQANADAILAAEPSIVDHLPAYRDELTRLKASGYDPVTRE